MIKAYFILLFIFSNVLIGLYKQDIEIFVLSSLLLPFAAMYVRLTKEKEEI